MLERSCSVIVGLRLNAPGLDSFRRNGWEVAELDATYDTDDQVEPVIEELRAEESSVVNIARLAILSVQIFNTRLQA